VSERGSQDSILKLLDAYGRGFGDDRATVISRRGPPRHVTSRPASNGSDSVFVLEYPGASFQLVRWMDVQREVMSSIRVWGQLSGLPPVVSLGSTTRSELLSRVGPPDYSQVAGDSTILSYNPPEIATDFIEFYVVRDTLRLLRWAYRVG
jgi:hypothetical protein